MNLITALSQNNAKTWLLIAVMQHVTDPGYLDCLAVNYFNEKMVGRIFNAAPIPALVLDEQKESDGLEPLDNSAGRTIKDLIRLLLADRKVAVNVQDSTGWPLLLFAVENSTVLEMLFAARPELANTFSTITARELNKPNSITWDAFTWAAEKGCTESLMFLLGKLAEKARLRKQREIISWFFTQDLKQSSKQGNFLAVLKAFALKANELNDLLFEAINANASLAIPVLLAAGSDVNAADGFGRTALMCAVSCDQPQAIRTLLEGGADVNVVDLFGQTALIQAASYGSVPAINALLKAGADVNTCAIALTFSAFYGHTEAVRALLAAGSDVNTATAGCTALMCAAGKGHAAVILELLAAPTLDVSLHNQAIEAIRLAKNHPECSRLIQDALSALANRNVSAATDPHSPEQQSDEISASILLFSQPTGNATAGARNGPESISSMPRATSPRP